jgi:hypothetical protein
MMAHDVRRIERCSTTRQKHHRLIKSDTPIASGFRWEEIPLGPKLKRNQVSSWDQEK